MKNSILASLTLLIALASNSHAISDYDFSLQAGGGVLSLSQVVHDQNIAAILPIKQNFSALVDLDPSGSWLLGLDFNANAAFTNINNVIDMNGDSGTLSIGYALVNKENVVVGLLGTVTYLDLPSVIPSLSGSFSAGGKLVIISPDARGEMSMRWLGNDLVAVSASINQSFENSFIDQLSFTAEGVTRLKDVENQLLRASVAVEKFLWKQAAFYKGHANQERISGLLIGLEAGFVQSNKQNFAGPSAAIYIKAQLR